MKTTFVALTLLVMALGLYTPALAETAFDSKSYLGGEAGLIAPLDVGMEDKTVTVPIALFDGLYWHRFSVEKNTNLSGTAPDFAHDYISGEAGIVGPID